MANKKVEAVKSFPKPTEKDFAIIKGPVVTEKISEARNDQFPSCQYEEKSLC